MVSDRPAKIDIRPVRAVTIVNTVEEYEEPFNRPATHRCIDTEGGSYFSSRGVLQSEALCLCRSHAQTNRY